MCGARKSKQFNQKNWAFGWNFSFLFCRFVEQIKMGKSPFLFTVDRPRIKMDFFPFKNMEKNSSRAQAGIGRFEKVQWGLELWPRKSFWWCSRERWVVSLGGLLTKFKRVTKFNKALNGWAGGSESLNWYLESGLRIKGSEPKFDFESLLVPGFASPGRLPKHASSKNTSSVHSAKHCWNSFLFLRDQLRGQTKQTSWNCSTYILDWHTWHTASYSFPLIYIELHFSRRLFVGVFANMHDKLLFFFLSLSLSLMFSIFGNWRIFGMMARCNSIGNIASSETLTKKCNYFSLSLFITVFWNAA